VAQTEGHQSAVARSSELGLQPLRITGAHRLGCNRERGTWGSQLGPHQGSGGDGEAIDGGDERQWLELGVRVKEGAREIDCEGKSGGEGRGAHRLYRSRGSTGERWPGW
jgi:hypothetical protein